MTTGDNTGAEKNGQSSTAPPLNMNISIMPSSVVHAEKPEKFNGTDFKRWQQKMMFYQTTLGLAKFLKDEPLAMDENETDANKRAAYEAWGQGDANNGLFLSPMEMMMMPPPSTGNITSTGYYFTNLDSSSSSSARAKILSHPHYHRLLSAYANCQKIGAPPEVVARLEEACASAAAMGGSGAVGEDPGLDQFMEAYCEMLIKYEQELSKPFREAMLFLSRVESQFKQLTLSPSSTNSASACATEAMERNGSSDDELDANNNNNSFIDPQAEDRELKGQLLRKYSGYLGSLKQEFMKKRKKGKLPKEARQQLLDWWSRHYKWPYPSESQKLALAESTGLDQKQINNWFINQRKRHWKPSEDMQFVVMDATHPPHYYMDNVLGNPFPMDISPALL